MANHFKWILTQLKTLTQILQQRYKDNANTYRNKSTLFYKSNIVIISLENIKINCEGTYRQRAIRRKRGTR